MRVALFVETYVPYINGVVTHVKALHDGLTKLGHEVLVVTADVHARHHYVEDGILHCPAKEMKRLYHFGLALSVSKERRRLVREFDPEVIHIHQEFGVGLSGFRIAKKMNCPIVYTMHTMYNDYLYYVILKPFLSLAKRAAHVYFKSLGKKATEITGPSAKVQEYFEECGLKKKVNIIPNPVEIELFSPGAVDPKQSAAVRERFGIAADDTLVCFCGRLGQEKNVDTLIGNWAQTVRPEDKLKLLILGGGPALEELRQEVQQLGMEQIIFFTGMMKHEDLPAYYGACQLYITASLSDTNSISMKEGMAAGLPVVHIRDPLNAGQVIEGVNGFIYSSAKEMYAILKRYQAMSMEEKQKLRDSVLDSVKIYSSEALAKNLLKIYEKAIAENRERPLRQ